LVVHRHREIEDLPQAVGLTREQRQPARPRSVDARFHLVFDPLQIGAGVVPLDARTRVLQHAVELEEVVTRTDVTAAVDVEITRRDRRVLPLESGELANDRFGDCCHGTSVRSGGCPPRSYPALTRGEPAEMSPFASAGAPTADASSGPWAKAHSSISGRSVRYTTCTPADMRASSASAPSRASVSSPRNASSTTIGSDPVRPPADRWVSNRDSRKISRSSASTPPASTATGSGTTSGTAGRRSS